jgi:predicted  nucleic acid-binding Zn-ribbon protein
MDDTEKNKIFDRMFEISLKVDPGHIPSPRTINENLGQCHIYLEEINKAYIKVIKEMSILQRHLNNRQTDFEIKLDSFISTNDEIIALPSSRDREAKAKTMLKSEIVEIKQLENEIEDLEKLIKVISMRHKDMARANMDIRIQSRLMESEIKLNGMSSPSDNASKDLLQDNHIWDGAITEVK